MNALDRGDVANLLAGNAVALDQRCYDLPEDRFTPDATFKLGG